MGRHIAANRERNKRIAASAALAEAYGIAYSSEGEMSERVREIVQILIEELQRTSENATEAITRREYVAALERDNKAYQAEVTRMRTELTSHYPEPWNEKPSKPTG